MVKNVFVMVGGICISLGISKIMSDIIAGKTAKDFETLAENMKSKTESSLDAQLKECEDALKRMSDDQEATHIANQHRLINLEQYKSDMRQKLENNKAAFEMQNKVIMQYREVLEYIKKVNPKLYEEAINSLTEECLI